ncbi:hypothetical protein FA13DRAFT_1007658 [Coprinellus micaceus]|uniref:Uncharacterized protein n=1 Tax=Coprinellus micaceus TaxID=71717 RepID=A0A4Y7SXV3_COPMI|nr:hypothetical protein FA13DRAFT_1007658 [Coprinellus micaceus]
MNVNTMIRQPGPATIKGNIVLGRPKPGSRPHTIVFCAEMFVGAATSAQVCGLLMFYNGEGATYPEAGYYNIESTFFFFDLENINAGFTQNDMLFYDFFGEIETLTYICPIDAPSPFFNRFTRMVMAAGGVATNCQRSAPWQFHLDIVGYSSDWKSSTTEKPATHILAKFTEQGRFRKQLAKNEAPPFPYPKRFVHVRGPIIDVVFDPVLRHPNGTPRVRRWVLDIASIHFFGSFNESNGSGISTIPNTLDCAATNAGSAHPRSFLNLGPSSLTPPSAAEPSAPTGPQFPATPFSSNQQWGVTYFQGATPYGAPSSAGPSNSSHVQAMPAGTGSVTHSGLPSSDQPTYGQPSVAPAPPPSMQAQPSFAPGPSQPTYSQPTGVPAPPPSTQAQPSFAPAPPMQASSHFSFAPPPSAQAQTAPAPPPSMQTHGFSFAPAQQTQGLSFAPAQQTQGYPSFIAAPGPFDPTPASGICVTCNLLSHDSGPCSSVHLPCLRAHEPIPFAVPSISLFQHPTRHCPHSEHCRWRHIGDDICLTRSDTSDYPHCDSSPVDGHPTRQPDSNPSTAHTCPYPVAASSACSCSHLSRTARPDVTEPESHSSTPST